jgi:hypothetical protein
MRYNVWEATTYSLNGHQRDKNAGQIIGRDGSNISKGINQVHSKQCNGIMNYLSSDLLWAAVCWIDYNEYIFVL